MATRRNGSGLETQEWVDHVVPDPEKVPDVVPLLGYVGRGAKKGTIRLYFEVDLNRSLEILLTDVLHSWDVTVYSCIPSKMILVRAEARITIYRRGQPPVEATVRTARAMTFTGGGRRFPPPPPEETIDPMGCPSVDTPDCTVIAPPIPDRTRDCPPTMTWECDWHTAYRQYAR